MDFVVEMKGITKVFPGVRANENVNFQLKKGEIHVLLGENGAGKTTLMNILYGLYQPDEGEIFVKGRKINMKSPSDAIANGIGMVHQHFMLVQNFTVAENIVLGKEPKKSINLDMNKAVEDTKKIADAYGFKIDPNAVIEDITVGQQQKVEILKALYRGAEILILDEPTAVLTPQEIEELGVILKNLVKEGKSIILITHKLKEVMGMSDRVTIIRRGKVINTVNTKDTNIEQLAEMMVGRKVNLVVEKKPANPKDVIFKVEKLEALDHRGLLALKGIDLQVRAGEILGIAGVDGNGQTELLEVITGLRKAKSGKVIINNKDVTGKSPKEIIESGISNIPEDRHKRGLVLKYSLAENSILGMHYKKPFANGIMMNYTKIKEFARKLIDEFDVRTPNEDVAASSLSGGNQQKMVVAREIAKDPDLIIAAQPTRGLDVGAIEYIHKRLVAERDKGRGVLLVSLELDEVMALSDRIAVIYDGEIVGVIDAKDATENDLGILMAGGTLESLNKGGGTMKNKKIIKSAASSLLFPLISIIVAMFVAVIFVMWAKHISFIKGVQVMFKAIWNGSFGRKDNFIETLVYVIPLLFTGLANAVAFKTGLFNIGVEGEFMISITVGAIVGIIPGIPPVIHVILVLIAGTLAGVVWAGIVGYLKAKVGSNEVVNSIMMNYIALYFSNYLIMGPFNKKGLAQTADIQPSAMLWRFLGDDYRVNIGLFIGLLMVVLVYIFFWKTTWGYEIRAVGINQYAAEYGGISIKKNIILAMAISGGIAGLGGAVYLSGIQHHAIQMVSFTGYGFDGIAVALLAKNNPIGIIFSALLFGALNTSSISLQMANIPKQIVFLIQAIILIFVAADYVYKWIAEKRKKGALLNE